MNDNRLHTITKNLRFGNDGVWYSRADEAVSYPDDGNDVCYEIEDASFWFRHRNECIIELVKLFPPRGSGPIFDVGGGNGFVAKGLKDAGWDVVLVEPGPVGARNAKRRGLENVVCATTQAAGFESGTMPAIGAFDVVEHIEDDAGFLRHLGDLLEPQGMLYMTVPAFPFLWSHEDDSAGHFRRYTLGKLKMKLQDSGYRIAFGTYIFRILPLPVFLLRTLPSRLGAKSSGGLHAAKRDHVAGGGTLQRLLDFSLKNEIAMLKKQKSCIFGGSCLIAAIKTT